jgi:hypothetical protein
MEPALSQPGDRRGEAQIEVRQYFELEDFGGSEAIERFRKIPGNKIPATK